MNSVFILEYAVDYEGGGIVNVYESRQQAERRKARIEHENERYVKEMKRTDYESNMKIPDYLHNALNVTEYKIITERRRGCQ
jgi:hypothetical protein